MLPIKIDARAVNCGDKTHGDASEQPQDSVHDREVDVHAPAMGDGVGFRVQGSGGRGGGAGITSS